MATSFLSRWSQRKLDAQGNEPELVETDESANLPDNADSSLELATNTPEQQSAEASESELSVASLLASEAESAVKKAALRKLFLSGQFSEIDGLNDYDHDYKAVKSLSSEVASKLREWVNASEEESKPSSDLDNNIELNDQDSLIQTEEVEQESELEQESMGQNIPHNK
ncbi:DUF3306 domain-containing protein [Vibrio sp. TRT 1302]|uniref:DUF3306 domain-containing protein n=1 Tax=Vibrio sp. TRT 1302 TaxID=3418504 RepID=UPI003CE9FEA8